MDELRCRSSTGLPGKFPETRHDPLHGVGHGRLALVKHYGCLCISAGVDHGQKGTPVFEGNAWVAGHIFIQ